jgi:hypothetical protein
VYARYQDIVLTSPFLVIDGEVKRKGAVINVIARYVRPMSLVEREVELQAAA